MKIKEILTKVNKSKQFEDDIDVINLCENVFNINYYNLSFDDYQTRLKSYFIGNWLCTDSWVGYKVYFFDDEPVAVSSQLGRKMTEEIEWVSKENYLKVKNYLLSFQNDDSENITLANLEEDIDNGYKIEYSGQLFNYHYEIPLYNNEPVKIIELKQPPKNTYDIEKEVKIKFQDDSEKWVNIKDLIFPYNLV